MKKKLTFLVCIAISFLINFLLYNTPLKDIINDYYKNVLIIIGINIILATSLNLITLKERLRQNGGTLSGGEQQIACNSKDNNVKTKAFIAR